MVTSITTTGPAGICCRYCSYLAASSPRARSRSSPASATVAAAVDPHPPEPRPVLLVVVDQQRGDPGWTAGSRAGPDRTSTSVCRRRPSRRCRRRVRSNRGRCAGARSASTVASRPTRASATRRRMTSFSTLVDRSSVAPHPRSARWRVGATRRPATTTMREGDWRAKVQEGQVDREAKVRAGTVISARDEIWIDMMQFDVRAADRLWEGIPPAAGRARVVRRRLGTDRDRQRPGRAPRVGRRARGRRRHAPDDAREASLPSSPRTDGWPRDRHEGRGRNRGQRARGRGRGRGGGHHGHRDDDGQGGGSRDRGARPCCRR